MPEQHSAERDVTEERRIRGLQARWMRSTERTTQWGVVLDDLGSADMYDTRSEAEEAFVLGGGLGFVRVTSERFSLPTTCPFDVGSRPDWMSPGQYDACRCLLPIGHEGDCECSHTRVLPPEVATP